MLPTFPVMFHKSSMLLVPIALQFNPQPPHISTSIPDDLFQRTKSSQTCIHCTFRLWLASGSPPSNSNRNSGIERQLKREIKPLRQKMTRIQPQTISAAMMSAYILSCSALSKLNPDRRTPSFNVVMLGRSMVFAQSVPS